MDKTLHQTALCGSISIMPRTSAAHRAVMMAALCRSTSEISPVHLAGVIRTALSGAASLGLIAAAGTSPLDEALKTHTASITGGILPQRCTEERVLDCAADEFSALFFLPLALDGRGTVRMRNLGADMAQALLAAAGHLPGACVHADGADVLVSGRVQSGAFSLCAARDLPLLLGLCFVLPFIAGDSTIAVDDPAACHEEIEITRRVQSAFGVTSQWLSERSLLFPGGQTPVSPGRFTVEGDWRQAALFLTAGAMSSRGPLHVMGVDATSAQHSRAVLTLLLQMGANICTAQDGRGLTVFPSRLSAIDADVSTFPCLTQILAVAMASAYGESRIRGALALRRGKIDRLHTLVCALNAAGASAEELPDGLIVRGSASLCGGRVDGCGDAQLVSAMAFAALLLSENAGTLTLTTSEAAQLAFPHFWKDYCSLCFKGREDL